MGHSLICAFSFLLYCSDLACIEGKLDVVALLLKAAGANLNAVDRWGESLFVIFSFASTRRLSFPTLGPAVLSVRVDAVPFVAGNTPLWDALTHRHDMVAKVGAFVAPV